jgi:hypothetical protein
MEMFATILMIEHYVPSKICFSGMRIHDVITVFTGSCLWTQSFTTIKQPTISHLISYPRTRAILETLVCVVKGKDFRVQASTLGL